ncbi:MAG TPA: glutathione S-transferase [Caulobacteraceae bacterium]|nr:glutathione S-transferase [Caulobacteraceae bacterium]
MITLWGRPNSINVQKVLWALDELSLEFEHIDAGGEAGGLDDPAFRAMNPHGRVPVLKDGETAIWESHSIVRYLCAAYGAGRLSPIDLGERAGAEAWMDWTLATLQPAISGLFWACYRTPAAQRDARRIEGLEADSGQAVTALERRLAARPFLAGDAFSMADIPAGVLVHRYFELDIARPSVPAVVAWRARLAARPAYAHRAMRPFGELFGRLAF